MLGFGALGEFALGEGPNPRQGFSGGQWPGPARRAGLTVAVIATTFVGFVPPPAVQAAVFSQFSQSQTKPKQVIADFTNAPQPAFVQPYIFSAFAQPAAQRLPFPDEQPSTLFEVEPPQPAPFTGFAQFEIPLRVKVNQALYAWEWWQPITLPIDTHDGVWVKKKKKRGPDPIDLELAEKASRRAALELAIYGPPVVDDYKPAEAPKYSPPPDVTELVKTVLAAQQAHQQRIRAKDMADDEDDLESILKDIL